MKLRIIELSLQTGRSIYHVVDDAGVRRGTFESLAPAERFVKHHGRPRWRRFLAASSVFFRAR